mmetsp:Transcript_86531/g.269310  ORF Transcript_86531/g.269310 Transcript_86531/m.269310 type:complete len:363 (-) Transcript_86531:107-1195(-)
MHYPIPCLLVACLTFGVLLGTLSRHGRIVQVSTCAFICSLTCTQVLMKALSSKPYLYRFPAHVTVLHLSASWMVSVVYWIAAGDLGKCHPRSIGSLKTFCVKILPMSCTLPIAVIFNNMALIYIAAGLNSIISALTPVSTALLSRAFGRTLTQHAWLGLLVALGGAVLISVGEAKGGGFAKGSAVITGVIYALQAVVFRSLKSVLQDKLLNVQEYLGEEAEGLAKETSITPMHLWGLQGPPMIAVSVIYALSTESTASALHQLRPDTAGVIAASCASAAVLNILGAMTIKALGASLMQAIGKLNVIVTVAFSVAFMEEELPAKVFIGAGVMLFGVIIFEKAQAKSEEEAQQLDAATLAAKAA